MISRGVRKILSIFRVSASKELEGKQEQEMLAMIEEVQQNIREVNTKIAEKKAELRQRPDAKEWELFPKDMEQLMGQVGAGKDGEKFSQANVDRVAEDFFRQHQAMRPGTTELPTEAELAQLIDPYRFEIKAMAQESLGHLQEDLLGDRDAMQQKQLADSIANLHDFQRSQWQKRNEEIERLFATHAAQENEVEKKKLNKE